MIPVMGIVSITLLYDLPVKDEPPSLEQQLSDLPTARIAGIAAPDPHPFRGVFHVVGELHQRQRAGGCGRPDLVREAEYANNLFAGRRLQIQVQYGSFGRT